MSETAATTQGTLRCVVVTPERAVLDETADFVALPMYDGELGVLPGRAPLIGRLGYGELRIRRGGVVERYYVDGGFAQIRMNEVTVLTSKALKPSEINADAAKQALDSRQHGQGDHSGSPEPTREEPGTSPGSASSGQQDVGAETRIIRLQRIGRAKTISATLARSRASDIREGCERLRSALGCLGELVCGNSARRISMSVELLAEAHARGAGTGARRLASDRAGTSSMSSPTRIEPANVVICDGVIAAVGPGRLAGTRDSRCYGQVHLARPDRFAHASRKHAAHAC